jgi:hypothetical protein
LVDGRTGVGSGDDLSHEAPEESRALWKLASVCVLMVD